MLQRSLLATLALLSLVFASCSSTQPLEARNLPFRIGVVPMEAPIVGEVSPGELNGEATELALELQTEDVTRAIGDALRQYCFSSVTVIDVEDLGPAVDSYQRQHLVFQRAREQGVDLLVELGLRYDREIYRENTSTFWLNIPLFLFASPSNWFLADNEYFADVELSTTVYDLHALEAGDLSLGDPTAQVVTTNARFTGSRLDFIDRSDDLTDYAFSILIPSGFLARETEDVQEELRQAILEELQVQIVQGIQSRRADLVRASWIAPVFIEPARVRLRRDGEELVVRGDVMLRRDGLAERVHALHFNAGPERVTVQPASIKVASVSTEEYEAVPFEARVPMSSASSTLRLECEAGSRDRYVRSYTFPIPASSPKR